MIRGENTYSRFVTLAKIILPLAAIALLSTLFLLSRQVDPTASLPYAQVDLEQMVRDQQITAPTYAGVTRDGTQIRLSAASAKPDPQTPNRANATELQAHLDFASGTTADIRADDGLIDSGKGQAHLSGNVAIDTSDGYRISADTLTAALNQTDIMVQGDVRAQSPMGQVTAQQMQITGSTQEGHVLVFKDTVKLVYEPGN